MGRFILGTSRERVCRSPRERDEKCQAVHDIQSEEGEREWLLLLLLVFIHNEGVREREREVHKTARLE